MCWQLHPRDNCIRKKLTHLLLSQLREVLCCAVLYLVIQPCPTLQPHGLWPTRLCLWGFSRQEYWSGLPCPPPGDLPNPGLPYWRHTLYHLIHQGSPWGHKELDTTQRLTHLLLTRGGTLSKSFPLPQAFPHLPKHLQQMPTPPRIVLRIQITNSTLIQQIY